MINGPLKGAFRKMNDVEMRFGVPCTVRLNRRMSNRRMLNVEVHFCGSTFIILHSTFRGVIFFVAIRIRGKGIFQYLSNLYCLTGRAGGTLNGLGVKVS